MNRKAQILNQINGKNDGPATWSPFLAFYWEHQEKEVQEQGQLAYMEKIGAAPLLRGMISPATIIMEGCNIIEKEEDGERTIVYETPVGSITERSVFTYKTWFLVEHPVKNKEDLNVLIYICEHIKVVSNVAEVNKAIAETGERGLHIPLIGLFAKSGFQSLLEHWIGTVNLVYAMMDYPEVIKECLAIMGVKSNEIARYASECDAEVFISWEDTSTTNISPTYYETYIRPEIDQWCDILHSKGKKYLQHACGHLRYLLPYMAESKIDGIESMSPEPTGNIDILEAADILPEHMTIIGGLEPTFLIHANEEDMKKRIFKILDKMKGRRYVLANSDSCPPEVTETQFIRIRHILDLYNSHEN